MCSLRPTSDLFSTPERRPAVERTTDIGDGVSETPGPREYSAAPATFARSAATAAGEIYSLSSPEKRARIKVYASFGSDVQVRCRRHKTNARPAAATILLTNDVI